MGPAILCHYIQTGSSCPLAIPDNSLQAFVAPRHLQNELEACLGMTTPWTETFATTMSRCLALSGKLMDLHHPHHRNLPVRIARNRLSGAKAIYRKRVGRERGEWKAAGGRRCTVPFLGPEVGPSFCSIFGSSFAENLGTPNDWGT